MKKRGKLAVLFLAVVLTLACLPLNASAEEESILETEPNDTTAQANPISYGQFVWGDTDEGEGADYFKFQAKRSSWGVDIASEFPLEISVYDEEGSEKTSDSVKGGTLEEFTEGINYWDFNAGETYYFKISSAFGDVGEYCILLGEFETGFTDMENHWAKEAAEWAYAQELFFGVNDMEFGPNQPMTRGMLTTVLWRWEENPQPAVGGFFGDVKQGTYYKDAVDWAYEQKLVQGTSADVFSPNGNITREQLAVILYRYAKRLGTPSVTGDLSRFSDRGKVSHYALEAMQWAVGQGIITGKENNRLDPTGFANRAEVATMLKRFLG